MRHILYPYFIIPSLRFLAHLPMPVLYTLGRIAAFLAWRVFQYRYTVVYENMQRAFPKADENTLRKFQRAFYFRFGEQIAESIKLVGHQRRWLNNTISLPEDTALQAYWKSGKSVMIVMGHFFNWECTAAHLSVCAREINNYAMYRPLSNTYFDELVKQSRSAYNFKVLPMREAALYIMRHRNEQMNIIAVADQNPPEHKGWPTSFMGSTLPFFEGPERIARKLKIPVVYLVSKRLRRGKYVIQVRSLCEDASLEPKGEVIRRYAQAMEKDLQEDPAGWLWSHRRWRYAHHYTK